MTGQEERDKEVQGHVHGAEHRSGKSGARGRRAERKPEAGSSGAGTDVAVTTCQFYFLIICHLTPQFTSDFYRDKDVFYCFNLSDTESVMCLYLLNITI